MNSVFIGVFSSTAPKSIACYYCNFRAPSVEEMEVHLTDEHLNEGEEVHRKRIRKRSARAKEGGGGGGDSSTDQTSDLDEATELSLLDETRESRNPNFECWLVKNEINKSYPVLENL